MTIGKLALSVSLPALMAAASMPARAADIVYPIDDPVYAPVPMALLGDLKLGVGFSALNHDLQDDDDATDTFIDVLGEGRVNMPVHGGAMQLQLDVGAYGTMRDGYGMGSAAFQGHLWHMRDNSAYGLLGGLALSEGPALWSIGAEAEHYYGNTTLGAYATYSFGSADGYDLSAFHVAGYVEHYVDPDHKVGLVVDYASVDSDVFVDLDAWGVVLSGEKRVSGTPFSYWAEAGYTDWSGGSFEAHAWGAMAGVRIALGGTPGMTLQEHDRYLPWDNVGSLQVIGGERAVAPSDRRLKRDIERVGRLANGLPLYSFRYLWSDEVYVGVMAQDVLNVRPDAVLLGADGYYSVDYGAFGSRMMTWAEWIAVEAVARAA